MNKENKESLRILWETLKHINMLLMGVLERERESERIFKEIMAEI